MGELKIGQINVGDEVESKIAQYFDKNGYRCTEPKDATVTIPTGTIGRISKIEGMPVFNTAQVYFPDFDMYVAFLITDLKKPLQYKK